MCNLQEHINELKYTIPDVMRLIHMFRNLTCSVCEWGVGWTYSTQFIWNQYLVVQGRTRA